MPDISKNKDLSLGILLLWQRGENKDPALSISIARLAPFSSFLSCRELPSKWLIKTGILRYPVLLSDNYLRLKAKDQQALKCLMGQSNKADICASWACHRGGLGKGGESSFLGRGALAAHAAQTSGTRWEPVNQHSCHRGGTWSEESERHLKWQLLKLCQWKFLN